MDARTAIETRGAVKQFDPNHRIHQSEIDELMSLAMLSPTAFNIQHWRFVVVHDPVIREAIRAVWPWRDEGDAMSAKSAWFFIGLSFAMPVFADTKTGTDE